MAGFGPLFLVSLTIIGLQVSDCLPYTSKHELVNVSSSYQVGVHNFGFTDVTKPGRYAAHLNSSNESILQSGSRHSQLISIIKGSKRKYQVWLTRSGQTHRSAALISHNDKMTKANSNLIDLRQNNPFVRLKRSTIYDYMWTPRGRATAAKCPRLCHCLYKIDGEISVVDCSNRTLLSIPSLPISATEVCLQNNFIKGIPCTAFKNMKALRKLNLSRNRIDVLKNCSFLDLISLEQLWLSGNNLTSLPAQVFGSFHHLIDLDLSENVINNLDGDLFLHLGKLSQLNLHKNKLIKISNGTFYHLQSLVYLSLQNNMLRYAPGTFEGEAFLGLTSLESLHLESNQPDCPQYFTYPDQALERLSTLKYLWLDGCPRAFGPGFSSLVNLSHLSFAGSAHCSMGSQIPSNFFNMLTTKQPLYLNMSACSIYFIPPDLFRALPNIHSLDLRSNQFLLSDGFEKASKGLANSTLAELNISDIVNSWKIFTQIRNTTFRYLQYTQLKVLVVERNSIINIAPKAILDLPQTMEYISFHDNKIIHGDALLSFLHLVNLKVAQISRQVHYRNRPGSFTYHDSQQSPKHRPNRSNFHINRQGIAHEKNNFSRNRTATPQSQSVMEHLHNNFDTHQLINAIENVGSSFCDDSETTNGKSNKKKLKDFISLPLPGKLEVANLSDTHLSYNIPEIHFFNNVVLKTLDFSANNINCFGGPIYGTPSMTFLDLSRNWCFRLNPNFFSHLGSLKTLLLYKNQLGATLSRYSSNVTFSFLAKLEHLDLSHNVIEDLSDVTFSNNSYLRILDLSNNELSQFNPSLQNNRKLEMLDLSFNILIGFSEPTCKQLMAVRESSPNFKVRISGNNRFLCNCDNLFFLNLLLTNPEIFEDANTFHCELTNGSLVGYTDLSRVLPQVAGECVSQVIFIGVLVVFFVTLGSLSACAVYHFKRWQWKYLYYMGKSRLHMDSTYLTYRPLAHAYITYDQENRRLRTMMKTVFRPRLNEMGITTVLGEVDFAAGPREPSIAGADYLRQFEVNLAIMHELYLRRPVLIPVLLFREEVLNCPTDNASDDASGTSQEEVRTRKRKQVKAARSSAHATRRLSRHVDDLASFKELTRNFPPEISTFLKGQLHRCLVYTEDTHMFWEHLKTIILEDQSN